MSETDQTSSPVRDEREALVRDLRAQAAYAQFASYATRQELTSTLERAAAVIESIDDPSDAAVLAAINATNAFYSSSGVIVIPDEVDMDAMREALRAALATS